MIDNWENKVPRLLCGKRTDNLPKWRRIVRMVISENISWENAIPETEYVAIDEVAYPIYLFGPSPYNWGLHIHLYDVVEQIAICANNETRKYNSHEVRNEVFKRAVIKGLHNYWFCLAMLAGDRWLIPMGRAESKDSIFAATVLRHLLWCWPEVIKLAPRFQIYDGVPDPYGAWMSKAMFLCEEIGISIDKVGELRNEIANKDRSPEEVAAIIEKWLDVCDKMNT